MSLCCNCKGVAAEPALIYEGAKYCSTNAQCRSLFYEHVGAPKRLRPADDIVGFLRGDDTDDEIELNTRRLLFFKTYTVKSSDDKVLNEIPELITGITCSSDILKFVGENCPNVVSVHVTSGNTFDDVNYLAACPKLENLTVDGANSSQLVIKLPQIKSLHVIFIVGIYDIDISQCSLLAELKVEKNLFAVPNRYASLLLNMPPLVEKLEITENTVVTKMTNFRPENVKKLIIFHNCMSEFLVGNKEVTFPNCRKLAIDIKDYEGLGGHTYRFPNVVSLHFNHIKSSERNYFGTTYDKRYDLTDMYFFPSKLRKFAFDCRHVVHFKAGSGFVNSLDDFKVYDSSTVLIDDGADVVCKDFLWCAGFIMFRTHRGMVNLIEQCSFIFLNSVGVEKFTMSSREVFSKLHPNRLVSLHLKDLTSAFGGDKICMSYFNGYNQLQYLKLTGGVMTPFVFDSESLPPKLFELTIKAAWITGHVKSKLPKTLGILTLDASMGGYVLFTGCTGMPMQLHKSVLKLNTAVDFPVPPENSPEWQNNKELWLKFFANVKNVRFTRSSGIADTVSSDLLRN